MQTAFFMAQPGDPPEMFEGYNIIVANPDMTPDQVKAIRDGSRRGARVLAYDNCQDAPSPAWDTPYWEAKRDVLARAHIAPGFCWFKDSPAFTHTKLTALLLAEFHREWTMPRGFDGIYLDMSTPSLPPWRLTKLRDAGFDTDAVTQLDLQYQWGRQFYTTCLRAELSLPSLLIANVGAMGAGLIDRMLDGIALEGVGTLVPIVKALAIVNDALRYRWRRFNVVYISTSGFGICWYREDEPQCKAVAEQLANAIPTWAVAGKIHSRA